MLGVVSLISVFMLLLIQLAVLRAEKQDKEKWLEEERVQIVEAAKEFAMNQEQTFVKKIDNLGQKLAKKEDDLQEMESVIKQLQYDLKAAQQEKVSDISLAVFLTIEILFFTI